MAANLFENMPATSEAEFVETLAGTAQVRIERIVSFGHASPPDFWYDQDESEWVAVLSGEANLQFFDGETVHLRPGDHVLIPPHRKHRVDATSESAATIWLAVFFTA